MCEVRKPSNHLPSHLLSIIPVYVDVCKEIFTRHCIWSHLVSEKNGKVAQRTFEKYHKLHDFKLLKFLRNSWKLQCSNTWLTGVCQSRSLSFLAQGPSITLLCTNRTNRMGSSWDNPFMFPLYCVYFEANCYIVIFVISWDYHPCNHITLCLIHSLHYIMHPLLFVFETFFKWSKEKKIHTLNTQCILMHTHTHF